LFENVAQSCLIRAEGKQSEADYLMDCSYQEYYYRALQYKKYCAWHKEKMNETKTE